MKAGTPIREVYDLLLNEQRQAQAVADTWHQRLKALVELGNPDPTKYDFDMKQVAYVPKPQRLEDD